MGRGSGVGRVLGLQNQDPLGPKIPQHPYWTLVSFDELNVRGVWPTRRWKILVAWLRVEVRDWETFTIVEPTRGPSSRKYWPQMC